MEYIKADWCGVQELSEETIDENVREDRIGNYRLAKKLTDAQGLFCEICWANQYKSSCRTVEGAS